jgi:hypothetical protein
VIRDGEEECVERDRAEPLALMLALPEDLVGGVSANVRDWTSESVVDDSGERDETSGSGYKEESVESFSAGVMSSGNSKGSSEIDVSCESSKVSSEWAETVNTCVEKEPACPAMRLCSDAGLGSWPKSEPATVESLELVGGSEREMSTRER